MNTFVFDIETVPDTDSGRRLYQLDSLSDQDVAAAMFALRRDKVGHDFLALHLHRIVAISVVFQHQNKIKVWSLGDVDADEKELVTRFFQGIEKYTPNLVSWNGNGFDLPVLHYRALKHGVPAQRYWENGQTEQSFRWNAYTSRYHDRHIDLMDRLAAFQARANAPLDEVAAMLGFPGKMGMSGASVAEQFFAGDIAGIRNYCETDVMNTYLVYLRFELMRGNLDGNQYHQYCTQLRDWLQQNPEPHFQQFLARWPN